MQSTSIHDIQWWGQQLEQFVTEGACKSPGFLKPFHFVMIALMIKRHGIAGLKLPADLANYAARMRLWEAADITGQPLVGKNSELGRFLPVERIADKAAVSKNSAALSLIAANACADKQTVDSLKIALDEILENCFAHAQIHDVLWGLACAQSWPAGRKAQIAIADCGIGIRSSLSENAEMHDRLCTENSCAMATELGVTSKPGKGHSGYGLALARQLIENNKGTLIVSSQGEYFSSSNGQNYIGHGFPWPGTLVVLEWNTDVALDVNAVYKTWPIPEDMTDDDFDF